MTRWRSVTIKGINLRKSAGIEPGRYPDEFFELYSVPSFDSREPEIVQGRAIGSTKQIVEVGDVLICKINPRINRVWIVGNKSNYRKIASSEWIVVTAGAEFDSNFLRYEFSAPFFRALLESEVSGVGGSLTRARPKLVENYPFPVPPLPEQKRIVAKLDKLFAHLDQIKARLERIPELLKQFRQAVLTQAVTGKLTEEWRKKIKIDLKEEIELFKNERDQEFETYKEEAKIRGRRTPSLPEVNVWVLDWAISMSVESAALFIIDCLHDTPKFADEGKYCIDTTCIEPFKIRWNVARKVSDEVFEKWIVRYKPTKGDILFSREGTIGTAVCVPAGVELCIGQRMMLFRFPKRVHPRYAEIFLNSPIFKNQVQPLVTGTTSPHVNISDLRKLSFTLPALEEQTAIVEKVASLFEKADSIEANYEILREKVQQLPHTILSKAFRGELVIAEKEVAGYSEEIGKLGIAAEP